ncbi:lipid kinase YegS [Haloferula sp.]|uniref:lipid kinase YegS n=1 Tax=Haloferula sp. TaxID=2497595 RepID=UPI00329EF764
MSETTTLILHRKSADRPEVKAAVKAVIKSGVKLRVRIPWNKKDKAIVVKEAIEAGASRVIAGGGDGTINAVADALVGKGKKAPRVELGILPLGTANDFARGCGLPSDNLEECLRIACTGTAQAVDVGRMNKRNFINVASLGFGAEVTATTPQDLKKKLGGGAYTLMGLAKVRNFQPYAGRVLVPGKEPIEGAMLIAAVGNNRFAGGGFEVAPKASMTDGLLDLAVINHATGINLAAVLGELKDPFNENNRYLLYRQWEEFTLESDTPLHCNLDGEPVSKRSLRFSVLRRHLRLVMPS